MVSVIIPVYNAEKYIASCLDSLMAQSCDSFEVVCIDDGSKDDSWEILERYAKQYKNIVIFHQDNKGVSAARNKGIDLAKGKYILFVDADDTVHKDYVKDMVELVKRKKKTIVVCDILRNGYNCIRDYARGERVSITRVELLKMILNNTVAGFLFNKIFDASIIKDNNLRLNENIHFCEDLLFCIEYMQYVDNYVLVNKPLYNYYINDEGVSAQKGYNWKFLTALLSYDLIKELIQNEECKELIQVASREYSIMCVRCAKMALSHRKEHSDEWKQVLSRVSQMPIKMVIDNNIPIKYRVYFVFLKVISRGSK